MGAKPTKISSPGKSDRFAKEGPPDRLSETEGEGALPVKTIIEQVVLRAMMQGVLGRYSPREGWPH